MDGYVNSPFMLVTLILTAPSFRLIAGLRVEETIFDCNLGAKRATVTVEGDRFTYRYGSRDKTELTISSYGPDGNIHAYWGRYVSPLRQLRFSAGEYSYILYTMAANERMDTNATGGLIVMKGRTVLADRSCKPWVEFTGGFDQIDALPKDDEEWSAMAL